MKEAGDFRKYFFALIILIFLFLSFKIVQSYLVALISAFVFAYILLPLFKILNKKLSKRISAGICLVVIILVLILPIAIIFGGIIKQANSFVNKDCEPWSIYFGSPARKIGNRRPSKKPVS